jgi:hypothetical protein
MAGTKKSRIVIFAIVGGIFGFSIHLAWHFSAGVNLLSTGPHAVQGIIHTLVGATIGTVLYVLIAKR